MDNFLQVNFTDLSNEQQEILIAELSQAGYEGFEQGTDFLRACISERLFHKDNLAEIVKKYRITHTIDLIQPKNWNEEWERSFEPVIVENFCAIRASFHPAVTSVQHEIIITPKMSFGTGHHATTFQVIHMMQDVDFVNRKVFDFGTGTGVLAILSEKLGASYVHAIDIDDWSIDNAKENVKENQCSRIRLEKAGSIPSGDVFDIILANINKHVILENLPSIAKQLHQQGVLILSGLLLQDLPDIENCAMKEKLVVKTQSQKYDWIAVALEFKV